MKKFSGKYEQICEDTLYRYQQSGFLCGDYVRIKKNALKHPMVESMSDQLKDIIKSAIKNETVLRISYIKSGHAEAMSGPVGAPNVPGCIWADIIFEYAPGMWKDPMTLPLAIVQKVVKESDAEGYVPYNDELIRPNDNSNKGASNDKQTEVTDTNRNLTTKNIKLANTKKPKDGRDSTKLTENTMTKNIMGKLRENDTIFENYVNHLNEGILSKAGGVVGAGAQKLGSAISKAGTKMRGPEASGELREIRAVASDPAQLAAKLSEIKNTRGPEALTNIIQQMIHSDLSEALVGAMEHAKQHKPQNTPPGRTPEGETPPSNASMMDGEDGSSVPTHSEKPSTTADYMN